LNLKERLAMHTDIQTWQQALPHGITLSCRAIGERGRPVLLFLHGFPEAAFVWDDLLRHFSRPENGGYRCVAPNLRGYERSSAPADVQDYRVKFLVQDVLALIDAECGPDRPLAALVAHDWGGAVAWSVANQHPSRLGQLVVINSPHPGCFLQALQTHPAQQAASAYMNFLVQDDAAKQLSANDFEVLMGFLTGHGTSMASLSALNTTTDSATGAPAWLSPEVQAQYRHVWGYGLQGGLNYYRASPLRPAKVPGDAVNTLQLPAEMLHIAVPTLVLWAQNDIALLPCLTQGLAEHIPQLTLVPIDHATHWVVHEQPQRVMAEIAAYLRPPHQ